VENEKITHLSAESMQNMDDFKTWARDHEIRMNWKVEQIDAAIEELKTKDKQIDRNLKLILTTSIGFGSVLAIVIILSGVLQMIKRYV